MQEVAVGHYRAFITAAEAVRSIKQEVTTIDNHLQNLVCLIFPTSCFVGLNHKSTLLELTCVVL